MAILGFEALWLLILLGTLQVQSFRSLLPTVSIIRRQRANVLNMVQSARTDLRNVAIIAHVDHGKTTLVDSMIRQSGAFRENQEVASMDSNDQEKERGITILAKNAAIMYKNTKINIVDTPGHADFGGEVERILNMVDGVLLVVDSVDGPKPQTRFVLKKALERNLRAIVVVNKIDRPSARPDVVLDRVFDLFLELGASDTQADFSTVYASGMHGIAGKEPTKLGTNLEALFDEILNLPPINVDPEAPLQLLVANVDYDDFKGKLGIGRLVSGQLAVANDVIYGQPATTSDTEAAAATTTTVEKKGKVAEVFVFSSKGREKVTSASAGDIVVFSGIPDIQIGDTVTLRDRPAPFLPPIRVEEPTVRMTMAVNKSPLAGREGKLLTSRVIRDRLARELEKNVALRVIDNPENPDTFEICGRGQLHLTVLIETMRREGFELQIGPPQVIEKMIDGVRCEPFEEVDISVPTEYSGSVVEMIAKRKGELLAMEAVAEAVEGMSSSTQLKFRVPTRGMIGVRSALMTVTKGMAVLDTIFDSYRPKVSGLQSRERGSLLAHEDGAATTYGLYAAQERGRLFVGAKTDVFKDMIVGIHQRPGDLSVNVCKTKQLTNMRAAGSDDALKLSAPMELTLDIAVEYIGDDELVEVTPTKVRMLKNPNYRDLAKRRKDALV